MERCLIQCPFIGESSLRGSTVSFCVISKVRTKLNNSPEILESVFQSFYPWTKAYSHKNENQTVHAMSIDDEDCITELNK